jgi:hypothetical protein
MAGAQAQTVSPSLLRSGGNALLGNQGGGGGLSQPILSSLATRRSQFGGVNMLAGFSNLSSLNGVSNPGLTGEHAYRAIITILGRNGMEWNTTAWLLGIAKRLCDDVLSIGTVLGTTCIIPLVMNV